MGGEAFCSRRLSAALAKKPSKEKQIGSIRLGFTSATLESEHPTMCNAKTHWIFGSLQPQLSSSSSTSNIPPWPVDIG